MHGSLHLRRVSDRISIDNQHKQTYGLLGVIIGVAAVVVVRRFDRRS